MPQITGKQVGPVGYGMMNLTVPWTKIPQEQAFAAMREALKQGSNFWNAGEFYGTPARNSLHLLNEYFTKYPEDAEKVVLSVKGGFKYGSMEMDGSKENVVRSIEECLKVLDGKKFIDVFECARVDPKVPIEETISYIASYVESGKIGGIGISEANAANIRKAASVHPIAAVEAELSLWSTHILDNGTVEVCGELGIPIIAYSPLGKGFLTGRIKTYEDLQEVNPVLTHYPRFQKDVFDENLKLVHEIDELAAKKGCTPGQVAIAWVNAQGNKSGNSTFIALPGSSRVEGVAENCKTVKLTSEELDSIDAILKKFEVKGDRYPAQFMKQLES